MKQDLHHFQWNRTLMSVLGGIWALPNTILGIVLGLLGRNGWQMHAGTIEVLVRNGPVHYVCHQLRISAFTLGDCILYMVPPCTNLREHEGRHTRQYWVLGPFFLPLYFMLLAVRGYHNHPLEKDARHWELKACGCLYSGNVRKPKSIKNTML